MSVEDAYGLLESIAKISGTLDRLQRLTPEDTKFWTNKLPKRLGKRQRRGPFRFSTCNIPFGSELLFVGDPNIKSYGCR